MKKAIKKTYFCAKIERFFAFPPLFRFFALSFIFLATEAPI